MVETLSREKVERIFANSTLKEKKRALNEIHSGNFDKNQLPELIDALENIYLQGEVALAKTLFVLYDKNNNADMAKYYLENCYEEIKNSVEYQTLLSKYHRSQGILPHVTYNKYDFEREYFFDGQTKKYLVFSFSKYIGKNMTLLKTPYGSIIFDCGAANGEDDNGIISKDDFTAFLQKAGIGVSDIKGVIISHAHLDHYGSLSTIIASGISPNKIYMSDATKTILQGIDTYKDWIDYRIGPVKNFFVPGLKLKIDAFSNGQILGSEGYVVGFDNINIVYSGDYCLHDQLTVKGLDVNVILQNSRVREYGIDCFITESTYGHRSKAPGLDYYENKRVLEHFVAKLNTMGYVCFFPAFSIGRSQEIILLLNNSYKIVVDGLSKQMSVLYEELSHISIHNSNVYYISGPIDRQETCDNLALKSIDAIISSAGMLNRNSAAHKYFEEFVACNHQIALIITGYMDSSREADGQEAISLWRSKRKPHIKISLSAHASYDELIDTIIKLSPKNVVAVHGNGLDLTGM